MKDALRKAAESTPATSESLRAAARGQAETKRLVSDVPTGEHKDFMQACLDVDVKAAPAMRVLAQMFVEDAALRQAVKRRL